MSLQINKYKALQIIVIKYKVYKKTGSISNNMLLSCYKGKSFPPAPLKIVEDAILKLILFGFQSVICLMATLRTQRYMDLL